MSRDSSGPAAELVGVSKSHGADQSRVDALRDISIAVAHGEFLSIMGPSGCGKSTLLNLLAGIDTPSEGRVLIAGHDLSAMNEEERSRLRAKHIGFVFQSFNLLPRLSVWDNVAWRLDALGVRGVSAEAKTREVLELVSVAASAWQRRPSELSGGEQQRVSMARALVTEPDLLLADEPTGNLDSATGANLLSLLRKLNHAHSMSIVLVTHDHEAALSGQRTIVLKDGRVVEEHGPPRSEPAQVVPFPGKPPAS